MSCRISSGYTVPKMRRILTGVSDIICPATGAHWLAELVKSWLIFTAAEMAMNAGALAAIPSKEWTIVGVKLS